MTKKINKFYFNICEKEFNNLNKISSKYKTFKEFNKSNIKDDNKEFTWNSVLNFRNNENNNIAYKLENNILIGWFGGQFQRITSI